MTPRIPEALQKQLADVCMCPHPQLTREEHGALVLTVCRLCGKVAR